MSKLRNSVSRMGAPTARSIAARPASPRTRGAQTRPRTPRLLRRATPRRSKPRTKPVDDDAPRMSGAAVSSDCANPRTSATSASSMRSARPADEDSAARSSARCARTAAARVPVIRSTIAPAPATGRRRARSHPRIQNHRRATVTRTPKRRRPPIPRRDDTRARRDSVTTSASRWGRLEHPAPDRPSRVVSPRATPTSPMTSEHRAQRRARRAAAGRPAMAGPGASGVARGHAGR